MRLLVKRGHTLVNDLRFSQGPVQIGRQPKSQVFLPDRAVSRQHAVIINTPDGSWLIQDLDSANRTHVNGRPISKVPLHEGDIITVGDFHIEVHFIPKETHKKKEAPIYLGDTIIGTQAAVPSIYSHQAGQRRANQPLHLAPERIGDFYVLNVNLCPKDDQEALLEELNKLLSGVTIASGGVLPNIQAVLLPKKTEKKAK